MQLSLKTFYRPHQAVQPLLVVRSPLFRFLARVMLLQAHGTEEILFYARECSLVFGRGRVENCGKRRAAGCVIFLVQARQIAPKASSNLVEKWSENGLCFFGLRTYGPVARTRSGSSLSRKRRMFHLRGVRSRVF